MVASRDQVKLVIENSCKDRKIKLGHIEYKGCLMNKSWYSIYIKRFNRESAEGLRFDLRHLNIMVSVSREKNQNNKNGGAV